MVFGKFQRRSARILMARAFLIAAAFFAASSSRAGSPQSGVPVLVEKAMQGCFSSAVRFTGLVVPRAETIVNLDVTGYQISALLVAEGDLVTAGQVLARPSPLTGSPAEGPSAPTGSAQQAGNSALRAPRPGSSGTSVPRSAMSRPRCHCRRRSVRSRRSALSLATNSRSKPTY